MCSRVGRAASPLRRSACCTRATPTEPPTRRAEKRLSLCLYLLVRARVRMGLRVSCWRRAAKVVSLLASASWNESERARTRCSTCPGYYTSPNAYPCLRLLARNERASWKETKELLFGFPGKNPVNETRGNHSQRKREKDVGIDLKQKEKNPSFLVPFHPKSVLRVLREMISP